MPKEVRTLFESLQSMMFQILDLAPGAGWFYILEAQRRVAQSQIESRIELAHPDYRHAG